MPNAILIVNDSLRVDHIASYGLPAPWPRPGHETQPFIETPNIDRLARGGTIFDRAYLSSYPTVPARHDMQTGTIGFPTKGWQPLTPDDVTLADRLGAVGIATQFVFDTTPLGQDTANFMRGFDGWEWVRGQHSDRYVNEPIEIALPAARYKIKTARALEPYLRNRAHWRNDSDWMAPHTVDVAVRWLERNVGRPEGFFLWVDMWDPHEPFDAPSYDLSRYVDPDYRGEQPIYPRYGRVDYLTDDELNNVRARYAANVQMADRAVGRLLDAVDFLGMVPDTLVIFTSDHGHLFGDHGLQGKPSGPLGALYEPTARVPLIVRRPDGVGAGSRSAALVHHPDICATVLNFFGLDADVPDGASLLPLIAGSVTTVRDTIFSGRYAADAEGGTTRAASSAAEAAKFDGFAGAAGAREPITVTTQRWTLVVRPAGTGPLELYDLVADPSQQQDVLDVHPDVTEDLLSRLQKFLIEHGASAQKVSTFDRQNGRVPSAEPLITRDQQLFVFTTDGIVYAFLSEDEALEIGDGAKITATSLGALLAARSQVLISIQDQYYTPDDLLHLVRA